MNKKEEILNLIFGDSNASNEGITLGGSNGKDDFNKFLQDATRLGYTTLGEVNDALKDKPENMTNGEYLSQKAKESGSSGLEYLARRAEEFKKFLQGHTGLTISVTVVPIQKALDDIGSYDRSMGFYFAKEGYKIQANATKPEQYAKLLKVIYYGFLDFIYNENAQYNPDFYYVKAGNDVLVFNELTSLELRNEAQDNLLDEAESYSLS